MISTIKRKHVILSTAIILAIIGLFPPWSGKFVLYDKPSELYMGYSFLFSPPDEKVTLCCGIIYSTLIVECLIVLVVSAGIIYFIEKRDE